MDLFRTILFYMFVTDATIASASVSCANGTSSEECSASIELLQTGIEFADLQVERSGAEEKTDACPGFFGGVNPQTTVVTDASTPGSFMAGMTGDPSMNITEPLVVMHYFPGVGQSPSATMRPKAFGNMFLDDKTMCIMPGAPIVGSCGKYRKVEYDGCEFPGADLSMGAIDTNAAYTVRGSTVENSGLIKGCEDKVVSSTLYCYRRTPATATGPPPEVDCSSCEASLAEMNEQETAKQEDACPGFFGGVNPQTTVVTDASTPGSFMAGMTGDPSMNITEPLVVMHYFPGVGQSPSATMRPKAFGNMFLDDKTMCIMPGAPIVGSCGKYRKVEYDGCEFPGADLSMGAIDTNAAYTVRGSTVENSGLIKGCEDKVVSSTLYCYRRTPATATGPPPEVDCSSCETSLAEINEQETAKQEDACPGFFGGVNPDTMVVTDASTPGSFMAGMTGDARMNITEPLVVMHYFPGVGQSPSATMRPKAFGNMFLDNKTMCIMPGAPIVGSCGKYRKVEYDGCDFPSADLSMGAIDTDAEYTVRGSTVENSGLVKGCEDKVVSSTLHCYLRTAATATGPPPAVDCSLC